MRALLLGLAILVVPVMQGIAAAAPRPAPAAMPGQDRFLTMSDGTRLHVIDAGPPRANLILLVPGWTMPAWIWEAQIRAWSGQWRVVAMDPRGQGQSDVPKDGYDHIRRSRDIAEVLGQLTDRPAVVVAWSLAVLETLALVNTEGDRRLAGLVLVDNSVGEDPPPPPPPRVTGPPPPKPPHAEAMRRFVRGMFRQPRDPGWLERLTQASLRTPEPAARALLSYPVPRTYWRDGLYATSRPILYVVRPRWAAQADTLRGKRSATETEVFADAGHALFVDEPSRFNAVVASFIRRRVWP
jgi:microsomal epoxide hydrolase